MCAIPDNHCPVSYSGYSERKLLSGLAIAERMVCMPKIIMVLIIMSPSLIRKIHELIVFLKAKLSSHLCIPPPRDWATMVMKNVHKDLFGFLFFQFTNPLFQLLYWNIYIVLTVTRIYFHWPLNFVGVFSYLLVKPICMIDL